MLRVKKKNLIEMFKTGKVHMENKTCFIHKFNVAYFQENWYLEYPYSWIYLYNYLRKK